MRRKDREIIDLLTTLFFILNLPFLLYARKMIVIIFTIYLWGNVPETEERFLRKVLLF